MLTEKESKVLDLIDENKEKIIEYLRKLISFKTVTPQEGAKAEGDDYKDLQNFVCNTLEEMNFSIDAWEVDSSELKSFPGSGVIKDRDLSNMSVLVGKLEGDGKGKSLILNGHYDVVPVGIIENWKHDPFEGEIEDNRIFGRGANDMKGGIAAMLHAIKFIQKSSIDSAVYSEISCLATHSIISFSVGFFPPKLSEIFLRTFMASFMSIGFSGLRTFETRW